MEVKVSDIEITVGETTIKLSHSEGRELYAKLADIYNPPTVTSWPRIVVPNSQLTPPYTVTCGEEQP